MAKSFRERVRGAERVVGTFLKTACHQTVEVLGASGLDFIVVDAEHAPFDRNQMDLCLMAARAAAMPALVRIPDDTPRTALDVLDMGAAGLLVPHAKSADDARHAFAISRYRGGLRGFSNSPRAGGYGRIGMAAMVEAADRDTVVVCQVEDREAVEDIAAIAAVRDVDCLFIGRADLAMSYGLTDVNHPTVDRAVERVCEESRKAGMPVGVFLGDTKEVGRFAGMGASLFVVGSDQSMLRNQASALVGQFQSA